VSSNEPTAVRIATRASPLARWQAGHVAALLRAAAPGVTVEIVHVTTAGDRNQTGPLSQFGGMGVFTREVQTAVLDSRADLAVHSLKDLPTETAAGLTLAAIPDREDTADALLLPVGPGQPHDLGSLPLDSRIGTGSLRRRAQLLHLRPDLQMHEIRGNVETRIARLDAGDYDALVLASAGLRRLGLDGRVVQRLEPPVMYPAVGQGALGIECRESDAPLRALLARIDEPRARACVTAERSLLAALRAGCHAPVGATTRTDGARLELEAVVLSHDGHERLVAQSTSSIDRGAELGREVANLLLAQGAQRLITPPRE
jgi:hydroxymethylbilane synthase